MKGLKFLLLAVAIGFTVNAMATEYILIRQNFWGRLVFTHVAKPGNLKKWYYDDKTDAYYRLKNTYGIPIRIVAPKHKVVQ